VLGENCQFFFKKGIKIEKGSLLCILAAYLSPGIYLLLSEAKKSVIGHA
jgi:hypothetical protein